MFLIQVELLKSGILSMFGEYPRETVARIVNQRHFSRLRNLLNDPIVKDSIVHGGSLDEDNLLAQLIPQTTLLWTLFSAHMPLLVFFFPFSQFYRTNVIGRPPGSIRDHDRRNIWTVASYNHCEHRCLLTINAACDI